MPRPQRNSSIGAEQLFTVKTQHRCNTARQAASHHNQHHCRLLRLPRVFIDRILDEMDLILQPLSILALRMTCRRLRNIVPPSIHARLSFDSWWREAFKRMLFRDMFPLPLLKSDQFLCSACKYFHGAHEFSKEELERSGEVRTCRGSSRKFGMCPHLRLTFNELKSAMANNVERTGSQSVACKRDHQLILPRAMIRKPKKPPNYDPPEYNSNPYLDGEQPRCFNSRHFCGFESSPKYSFTSVRAVGSLYDVEPTVHSVARVLRNNTDKICPHVRVCDDEVIVTFHTRRV